MNDDSSRPFPPAPRPPVDGAHHDALRRRLLTLAGAGTLGSMLAACGGGGDDKGPDASPGAPAPTPSPTPSPSPSPSPSPAPAPGPAPAPAPGPTPAPPAAPTPAPPAAPVGKRGIAYDLKVAGDFKALAGPVGWYYNWAPEPDAAVRANPSMTAGMVHVPMLWNGDFNDSEIIAKLKARPEVTHMLVMNEPNLNDQANLMPAEAATIWRRYEAVAAATGVKIVGPAMTWGTKAGYEDPVVWMDAFYAAYRAANGGRDPVIDALAFHWYDYGLASQLNRLTKYGKPFWVTEMANWHRGDGSAEIDSPAKQKAQMADMVAVCESRADVIRYAWFTGRWEKDNDPHFTSLLGASGVLTEVGQHYVSLPKV